MKMIESSQVIADGNWIQSYALCAAKDSQITYRYMNMDTLFSISLSLSVMFG